MSEDEPFGFLPFDTDDRSFVRGFQMGLVYQRYMGEEGGDILVYADSAEMLVRMQERGAEFVVTAEGDDWLNVGGTDE